MDHEHSKRELKAERGIGLLVDALFCGARRVRQDEEFSVASASLEGGLFTVRADRGFWSTRTDQDDEA